MTIGRLSSISTPHLASPYAPATVAPRATETAPTGDTVRLGTTPLNTAATAAPAEETSKRSVMQRVTVGLALAASMMGLTGCTTMMAVQQLPNIEQNVSGNTTKGAYSSLSFLDSLSAQKGGGLYEEGKTDKEYRLSPLDAVDRMMDGKSLVFAPAQDGKSHPIRSWAELRGLDELFHNQQQKQQTPERAPQTLLQQN